jgi:8-oxo-dGTP diphosphatase
MSIRYNCALTVDCLIFSGDSILLIKRKFPPFEGQYALPGGFVDEDETVESACIREAKEETNLDIINLKLVGIYSKPGRDPRGRTVTAAFLAEAKDMSALKAGDDAKEVELVRDWKNAELAFDHRKIIEDAMRIANHE